MLKWFAGKGRLPSAGSSAVLSLCALFLAGAGEWAGFASARWLGETSILGVVVAALVSSALIGAHLGSKRPMWAGFIAFCAGIVIGLLNYLYLYWIRVVLLQEIDGGLFYYFGTVYGAGLQVTAILCGFVAALFATFRK